MRGVEAAFFDLDKTILSRSSSLVLGRPMYQAGMVSRRQLVKGAYAQVVYHLVGADERRMERMKAGILELTRGWERVRVEEIAREALVELADPYIYQEALDLIAEHRADGRAIFIVSSSPEEIVAPLAEHVGVPRVIATRARVVDGKYTGELAFYCSGEGKAEAIRAVAEREDLDLAGSFAYSDSITDLPMLEAVGNPVAVNPDRDLRRVAVERSWPILDFRRRVRLQVRLPLALPGGNSTVAGALALAAVGVAVRWAYGRPRRTRAVEGGRAEADGL